MPKNPGTIAIDAAELRQALRDMQAAAGDLSPALRNIGEILVASIQDRFETKTAPDGSQWLGNADSTIARKGRDNPLFDHGDLARQIFYHLIDPETIEVGSSLPYAAMQQFGGAKQEFPWLWGDIPARPFLGISADDQEAILDQIRTHIDAPVR